MTKRRWSPSSTSSPLRRSHPFHQKRYTSPSGREGLRSGLSPYLSFNSGRKKQASPLYSLNRTKFRFEGRAACLRIYSWQPRPRRHSRTGSKRRASPRYQSKPPCRRRNFQKPRRSVCRSPRKKSLCRMSFQSWHPCPLPSLKRMKSQLAWLKKGAILNSAERKSSPPSPAKPRKQLVKASLNSAKSRLRAKQAN